MSSEPVPSAIVDQAPVVIDVKGVSKCYHIYTRPEDRLKQVLFGSFNRYYKEFWALRDIDLTVRRGEAVALIGRNGAGKSTLLEVISTVLTPTAGRVSVTGRVAPLLQLGTSFNPEFTGHENIAIGARILGLSDEEIRAKEASIVEFAEIDEFIHQPVRTYSSGMSARLAFAIAAHVDADILILDEVLAVGDIGFTQKCARFIKDFRDRGTLLFVSHDIGTVLAICDRAVWIDHGEVVEDDTPKTVVPHYSTWMGNPEKQSARQFVEKIVAGEGADLDQGMQAIGAVQLSLPETNEHQGSSSSVKPQGQPETTVHFEAFNWESRSSGLRQARIVDCWWEDLSGERISLVEGGQHVILNIRFTTDIDLISPILGYGVQNRLGQTIFAWDTSKEIGLLGNAINESSVSNARFTFRFPHLQSGDYTVVVALADGDPDKNVQQHWMFDALPFHVVGSRLAQGLIGVETLAMGFKTDVTA